MQELQILILEDVPQDVVLINRELRKAQLSFRTQRVETKEAFLAELQVRPPDLILSDHGVPGFDGFMALAIARDQCPETPFIFVSSARGEEMAIATFESGATDYVLKNQLSKLPPVIERAMREAMEKRQRKQAEKELKESEERFRMLVEGIKDYAMFMLDPEGRITLWNAGGQWMKGYSAKEILGCHFKQFYLPEAVEQGIPERDLQTAVNQGRLMEEGWRLRKGGSRFWARVVITPLRDEHGHLVGFAHVTHDLTAQHEAELQLQTAKAHFEARLWQCHKDLSETRRDLNLIRRFLTSSRSSPLTQLLAQLQTEFAPSHPIHEFSRQTVEFLNGLNRYLRLCQTGFRPCRVDLNGLVADLLPRQGRGRAPPLQWKLGGLPILHLDPNWIHEAWHQLIQSALQFNVGSSPPLVEMGSFIENKQWVCYMHHDGWNLTASPAPAAQDVCQSDGAPLKNPLWETRWWIVHRILQRHGGRVWVKSQGNSGTAVYLGFPLSLQAE